MEHPWGLYIEEIYIEYYWRLPWRTGVVSLQHTSMFIQVGPDPSTQALF